MVTTHGQRRRWALAASGEWSSLATPTAVAMAMASVSWPVSLPGPGANP